MMSAQTDKDSTVLPQSFPGSSGRSVPVRVITFAPESAMKHMTSCKRNKRDWLERTCTTHYNDHDGLVRYSHPHCSLDTQSCYLSYLLTIFMSSPRYDVRLGFSRLCPDPNRL